MKEVPCMGISCISQVQLPWGKPPGSGHVLPDKKQYNNTQSISDHSLLLVFSEAVAARLQENPASAPIPKNLTNICSLLLFQK